MKVRQTTCPSLTCRGVIPLESRFCMWCGTAIPPDARLPVHDLLDRLEKGDWTEALCQRITNQLSGDWARIKARQALTAYFLNIMQEARVPQIPRSIIPQQGGDASTGPLFENAFALLFALYLRADPRFWAPDGSALLDFMKNKGIAIPGMDTKQKPDILVMSKSDLRPLLVVELKASFTKHTLKHTYAEFEGKYHKLASDLPCFFVIFRTSSQQKIDTYKGNKQKETDPAPVPNCRVICTDFTNGKQPKVVDPVEDIFEKLKSSIVFPT